MTIKRKNLVIIILILTSSLTYGLDKTGPPGFIQPGRRVSGSVILTKDQISYSYTTYKIRVPDSVFKMEVKLDKSQADLDIFMNHNREIENYDDVDYFSTQDLYNEKLSLSRIGDDVLYSGVYYIDIVYPLEKLPVIDNQRVYEIPFDLTVNFISVGNPVLLEPEQGVHSSLSRDGTMLKLFAFDVDQDMKTLRIDIFNTKSDLDMYVSYEKPAFTFEDADYVRESYLGYESLIINSDSIIPLKPGRYYISVFDRIEDAFSDDFSIITSLSEEAPALLKEYPDLPVPSNSLEEALLATVEITTETGSGSGCLVSDDGYIITGLHVITDISGEIAGEMFISMNLSNYYPPKELFKAELIDFRRDEDLALLKIVSGLYGQDLIEDYKFPHYVLGVGKQIVMGQSLSFLGYPQIGSEGSRASISLTKGIVSGFDTMDFGYLIKTDGEINSGNSGGAAFDDDYKLIGFPMSVISDEGGQIAYIHPVSLIPEDWLKLLNWIE